MRSIKRFTSLAATLAFTASLHAEVTFLGYAIVDGKSPDASNLTNTLEDGSPNNAFDGFGSGAAYTGSGNRYVLLADRGPNKTPYPGGEKVNNTTSYDTRFQTADITVSAPAAAGGQWTVKVAPVSTSLLRDEHGRNFCGLATLYTGSDPTQNLRLDPESVRVAPDGTVYISDEYGPNIYHFDATGKRIGVVNVPEKFKVAKLVPTEIEEIAANAYVPHSNKGGGRVTNKGFEGLAITPDGSTLIAALQAPLIQDGGEKTRYVRFLITDLRHPNAPQKEVVYQLSPHSTKTGNVTNVSISEIVAVNDHVLLVDERDGLKTNKEKYAFLADLSGATDVSATYAISDLTPEQLAQIKLVKKSEKPLIDFKAMVERHLNPDAAKFLMGIPDKIEGFAFGPDLPDGRHLLIVTNDNDFLSPTGKPSYPNYVFAFAIDPADLPGYQAQQFHNGVATNGK